MSIKVPDILSPHGRIARRPLALWCTSLLDAFNALEDTPPSLNNICPIFNQAALIHSLRYDTAKALALLDKQTAIIRESTNFADEEDIMLSLIHVDVNRVRSYRHHDLLSAKLVLNRLDAHINSLIFNIIDNPDAKKARSTITDFFIERCKLEVIDVRDGSLERCIEIARHPVSSTTVRRVAFEAAAIIAIRTSSRRVIEEMAHDDTVDGLTRSIIALHHINHEVASGNILNAISSLHFVNDMAAMAIRSPADPQIDRLYLLSEIGELYERVGNRSGAHAIWTRVATIAKSQRDLPFYLRSLNGLGKRRFTRDRLNPRFPIWKSDDARSYSGLGKLTSILMNGNSSEYEIPINQKVNDLIYLS